MDVFLDLASRLIPLYLVVGAGFFSGRFMGVDRDSVAKLVIYVVSPVVIFTNVSQVDLRPEFLAVPIGFALVCSMVAAGVLLWGRLFGARFGIHGASVNLLAFSSGNANTGYFGLPVALMLFGPEAAGIYLLFILGFLLYENSVGFYILARGKASAREAFARLLRLPAFYAFGAALIANTLGMRIEGAYADFSGFFRGAYSVLGVMLIGMGVAQIRTWRFDWRFTLATFVGKFLVWPLLVALFIEFDRTVLYLYSGQAHQMMLLIACCPLAANTVAFATLLRIEPEKAGVSVLLSTLFALGMIPAMVALLF